MFSDMVIGCGRKITNPRGFAIALWALAAVFLLSLGLSTSPSPVRAESNLFTVRDVPVDATAASAVEAREEAIAEGHREAFAMLLSRLVPLAEVGDASGLPLSEIFALSVDFSVRNERTSGVRYLADMTVRFREEKVQSFLRRSGLRFAVARSQPILVLPILSDGRGTRLWLDNPWYDFWLGFASDANLLPLLVPLGDLEDMTKVTIDGALALDSSILSPLAERYGSVDVIVSFLEFKGDLETGSANLKVTSEQFSSQGNARLVETFDQQPGEDLDALLARAAGSLNGQLLEAWKLGNLIEFGEAQEITVSAYTPDLTSWLQIKDRLENTVLVDAIKVRGISRVGSRIDIFFSGSEFQLADALAGKDLRLAQNADLQWELSMFDKPFPLPSNSGFTEPGLATSGASAPNPAAPSAGEGANTSGGYTSGEGPTTDPLEEHLAPSGASSAPQSIQAE